MAEVTESIDVAVPISTAYNQWTQFEDFPAFMEGVKSVTQMSDRMLHWIVEVGGKQEEWDAEIVDQKPDQRIAWRAIGGKGNAGIVLFEPIDVDHTRITVTMDWQPEGVTENLGAALGFDDRKVSAELRRFKELIESRGFETGAWRGRIGA